MTSIRFLQLSATIVMMFLPFCTQADNSKALMNADYVRVREKPLKDAAQLGYLYKNMIVEITSQTQDKEKIGNDSYYWYEVKGDDVSGWVYGKFLSPNVTNLDVDTYDAPGDTQWLSQRFGDSTWYYNQNFTVQSFSMDEYRSLMRAAENGNEQAWSALYVTILKHLRENPDDPSYAYLKKRLYSEEFIINVLGNPYAYNNPDFFSVVPYSHAALLTALQYSSEFFNTMPDEYWNDREIVLLSMNNNANGCQNYIAKIPQALARDPQIKVALNRCRSGR